MRTWPLRLHARLPDNLRRSGSTAWGERNRRDPFLHSWLEGPVVDSSGQVLFVDVAYGRVFVADQAGHVDVVLEYEGAPNGLAFSNDGELVIADGVNGLIWADSSHGELVETRRLESWDGEDFLGLNDLVIGAGSEIFVTDQGMTGLQDPSGRVLHLTSDGVKSVLLERIPSPNGLALGRNELLLAVTRDNSIWRVPFDGELNPYRVGRFIQMSGGTGPDGIALHDNGLLFVAHLGMGLVWVCDERGRQLGAFEPPAGLNPTNVAISPEERVVYVTEADSGEILVGDLASFH